MGKVGTMPSTPDSHRDRLDGMVATLATIGSNGYPQISELWFLAETPSTLASYPGPGS
jgi:hypothetical protein